MASDGDLRNVLSHVESSGNQYAMRFEDGLFKGANYTAPPLSLDLIPVIKIHACSHATAAMIWYSSWGQWQFMGFNIYGKKPWQFGFDKPINVFMEHPEYQVACYEKYLDGNGINYSLDEILASDEKRMRFIHLYNGPGDMNDYWFAMRRAIKTLGLGGDNAS